MKRIDPPAALWWTCAADLAWNGQRESTGTRPQEGQTDGRRRNGAGLDHARHRAVEADLHPHPPSPSVVPRGGLEPHQPALFLPGQGRRAHLRSPAPGPTLRLPLTPTILDLTTV